ncbi:DUF3667 domain-containing protein [Aquimarina sp. MMG015]|uniref:DUF3667 domain-containing protein n=1 Tax=Aquimarina TaxID=290174 RepID=UPI0004109EA2|nr:MULTISPECIES: DUF3667 domain-containing protein [Aquimarina]MBQ4802446.1 DUF3667 domain-containing protein [Aquimarina sp. MMG015]
MNCRNCENILADDADYCQSCGAKVIRERITLKGLKSDFFSNVLGLDNLFVRTLIHFVTSPDKVISEYISGTRKRYINPFAFLVIGTAVATFIFNFFSDDYSELILATQTESFYESLFSMSNPDIEKNTVEYQEKYLEYKKEQAEANKVTQSFMLKYFNIIAFMLIPFYTFLAVMVFGRKRFNYGEHLVINSYLLGFGLFSGTLFFLLGLLISPSIYFVSSLVVIFYYLFTYKKLCSYSIGQMILKLLKFVVVLILSTIVFFIFAIIIGIIIAYMRAMIFG